jgi:hypothetical protein
MEVAQRRAPTVRDINDAESEEVEVKEAVGDFFSEECLLRAVFKLGARAKVDIPMYDGNLDVE